MSDLAELTGLGQLESSVGARLERFDREHVGRRIWARDETVWAAPGTPEITNRLGWLTLPTTMDEHLERLDVLAEEAAQFETVALIGMGGSSLAPEVYQSVFGNAQGQPELIVLDSTHPRAVLEAHERLNTQSTLFLVASKSGSTLETMSLYRYFWEATGGAGDQFVALTDPGSALQYLAEEREFRHIFSTNPDVGGRYSALTFFGLVPAAVIGVDLRRLLAVAGAMEAACGPDVPAADHPGLRLGAVMGEAALAGRDKLTVLTDDRFSAYPEWLEQLVAESTGKNDVGIVPIADDPHPTGPDRLYLTHGQVSAPDGPTMSFGSEPYDLAAEMYRAEFATAVAGAVLGIQPFDQPNVESAKVFAREAMAAREPVPATGDLEVATGADVADHVEGLLAQVGAGDYIGLHAYLPPSKAVDAALQSLRSVIGASGNATTAGVGPRFLHSTGQLHKGGANNGVFLQILDGDRPDVPVPETDYSFGDIIDAQAFGDAQALVDRDRRLARIEVTGPDEIASLV